MLPLKQQACRGRAVYFYDQVGAGLSERPTPSASASAPWLLNLSYYPAELSALVAHLGLTRHHVLGSSWGTIVAQLYALQQPAPPGLSSLVLSGPLSDSQLYIRSQWDDVEGNLGSLPPHVQRRLRSLDEAREYASEEYQTIARALTPFFTVRTTPPPDCFERSNSLMADEIYVGLQGASEFTIGGVLEYWNITRLLPSLGLLPTLLTYGRFDTMRPPLVRSMARALGNARRVEFPHSGHCSMLDDPGLMNDAVDDFLSCVERGECAEPEGPVNADVLVRASASVMAESRRAALPHGGWSAGALAMGTTVLLGLGASVGFIAGRSTRQPQPRPSPRPSLPLPAAGESDPGRVVAIAGRSQLRSDRSRRPSRR